MPDICHLLCIHPANHVKPGGKNRSELRAPRAHTPVAFVTLARLSVCSEASWRQGQTLRFSLFEDSLQPQPSFGRSHMLSLGM